MALAMCSLLCSISPALNWCVSSDFFSPSHLNPSDGTHPDMCSFPFLSLQTGWVVLVTDWLLYQYSKYNIFSLQSMNMYLYCFPMPPIVSPIFDISSCLYLVSQSALPYCASYISQGIAEGFVEHLWKMLQNPNTPAVIRQAAGNYIGSFLARAKFIPVV